VLDGITSGNAAACTVTGSDQASNEGTDTITVTYIADLVITTTALSATTEDIAYTVFLSSTGGQGNKTWDNNSGGSSLGAGACTGLSITTHTDNQLGKVSGTPTTVGTCNFTAKVTDSQGTPDTDTQALSVVVNIAAMGRGEPAVWVGLLALFPLALLLFTGLYLFALPYAARWRGGRRTDSSQTVENR